MNKEIIIIIALQLLVVLIAILIAFFPGEAYLNALPFMTFLPG